MHTEDTAMKFRLYVLRNCELYFKQMKYFFIWYSFPFTNSECVKSDNIKK